jgi:hypothetical protein
MWLRIDRGRLAWQVGLLALELCACRIEPLTTTRLSYNADSDGDAGAADIPDGSPGESELDSGTVQRDDGEPCSSDAECASDHCNGGFCCAEGDCCQSDIDCEGGGEVVLRCDRPAKCQGSRGRFTCQEHRCQIGPVEDDDSACTDEVKVDGCGAYRSVYCNGEPEQRRPGCPEACSDDADCDPGAACSGGVCGEPDAVSESMPEAEPMSEPECEDDDDCDRGGCTEGRCCRPDSEDCPSEGTSTADEQERCFDVFGRNVVPEPCRACACERCTASALACLDSGGDRSSNRCSSVTTCGFFSGCLSGCNEANASCLGEACYCGQGNSSCTVPYGPCVESITAAAETGDPDEVLERTGDPAYPLYDATRFAQCMRNECGRECVAPDLVFSPF